MNRRIDIWTRITVALMLALLLVTPVTASACEVKPDPSVAAVDCATLCAEAGVMPIDCAEEMADGSDCGDMLPAPEPSGDEPLASTTPVQAPPLAAMPAPTPLFDDDNALLAPLRASVVERPPLDPLGVRILI